MGLIVLAPASRLIAEKMPTNRIAMGRKLGMEDLIN